MCRPFATPLSPKGLYWSNRPVDRARYRRPKSTPPLLELFRVPAICLAGPGRRTPHTQPAAAATRAVKSGAGGADAGGRRRRRHRLFLGLAFVVGHCGN